MFTRSVKATLPLLTTRVAGRRFASTMPAKSSSNQALLAAGAIAVGAGTYYYCDPLKTSSPSLKAESNRGGATQLSKEQEDKLDCERVRHWEEGYRKRKAVEEKHDREHEAELEKLDKTHPGYAEHRKKVDAQREKDKKHEVQLVMDRHAESCPGMGGKTRSWAEKKRAKKEDEGREDEEMKELKKRLIEEGKFGEENGDEDMDREKKKAVDEGKL